MNDIARGRGGAPHPGALCRGLRLEDHGDLTLPKLAMILFLDERLVFEGPTTSS